MFSVSGGRGSESRWIHRTARNREVDLPAFANREVPYQAALLIGDGQMGRVVLDQDEVVEGVRPAIVERQLVVNLPAGRDLPGAQPLNGGIV